tara:strand:+ start:134 stop:379 length:246 start_codon:yes stop_codon:yes gene_type:complete
MSTISELKAQAKAEGEKLVKRYQELENYERQILAEKKQIEKQVDLINGEINGYNKIEPPNAEVPTEAPSTDTPPTEAPVET